MECSGGQQLLLSMLDASFFGAVCLHCWMDGGAMLAEFKLRAGCGKLEGRMEFVAMVLFLECQCNLHGWMSVGLMH